MKRPPNERSPAGQGGARISASRGRETDIDDSGALIGAQAIKLAEGGAAHGADTAKTTGNVVIVVSPELRAWVAKNMSPVQVEPAPRTIEVPAAERGWNNDPQIATPPAAAQSDKPAAVSMKSVRDGLEAAAAQQAREELKAWVARNMSPEQVEQALRTVEVLAAERGWNKDPQMATPLVARQSGKPATVWQRIVPRPRRVGSPDKLASRERRRLLGGGSLLPPELRVSFTEGERAVLSVIAFEAIKSRPKKRFVMGHCELPLDAIAARAGTSRSTVKNAIREARRLSQLTVVFRPRVGQRSKTNLIAIGSDEWARWLSYSNHALRARSIGVEKLHPTKIQTRISAQREMLLPLNGGKE